MFDFRLQGCIIVTSYIYAGAIYCFISYWITIGIRCMFACLVGMYTDGNDDTDYDVDDEDYVDDEIDYVEYESDVYFEYLDAFISRLQPF